jgi:hypothetical protein
MAAQSGLVGADRDALVIVESFGPKEFFRTDERMLCGEFDKAFVHQSIVFLRACAHAAMLIALSLY